MSVGWLVKNGMDWSHEGGCLDNKKEEDSSEGGLTTEKVDEENDTSRLRMPR
jgi:hypothetical protein